MFYCFLNNNPQYDKASDIVKMRVIAKSHVSKAIDLLYKKGLINVIHDKNDKRINHLIVLDQAQNIIEEGKLCQKEFHDIFFKNMSEDEVEQMMMYFRQINENVQEELKCLR